jgi:hypothetical protein
MGMKSFFSNINGGKQTKGVWEERGEETIWTKEEWSDGWRKLSNAELLTLYCPPNRGTVARMEMKTHIVYNNGENQKE